MKLRRAKAGPAHHSATRDRGRAYQGPRTFADDSVQHRTDVCRELEFLPTLALVNFTLDDDRKKS
jgi:hypothetical protein